MKTLTLNITDAVERELAIINGMTGQNSQAAITKALVVYSTLLAMRQDNKVLLVQAEEGLAAFPVNLL